MAKDKNLIRIRKFFSELSGSDLSTEDQIKLLDTMTEEAEELKLEAEKYAQAHNVSFTEALKKVCQKKKWQKINLVPNAVKAPK